MIDNLNKVCSDVKWSIKDVEGGYMVKASLIIGSKNYDGKVWAAKLTKDNVVVLAMSAINGCINNWREDNINGKRN